jgi:hypothetical protein
MSASAASLHAFEEHDGEWVGFSTKAEQGALGQILSYNILCK